MNRLTPPKQTPEIVKFLRHGLNGLNLLLVGAGVLSCAAYGIDKTQPINLYLGIFLFVLVFFDMVNHFLLLYICLWRERKKIQLNRQINKLARNTH